MSASTPSNGALKSMRLALRRWVGHKESFVADYVAGGGPMNPERGME